MEENCGPCLGRCRPWPTGKRACASALNRLSESFESFKRELTGLPCKRKLEDNSGSRSKENKRPEKRGDRRDRWATNYMDSPVMFLETLGVSQCLNRDIIPFTVVHHRRYMFSRLFITCVMR